MFRRPTDGIPDRARVSFLRAVGALFGPRKLSEPLARADHELELARNAPLRSSPPERQDDHFISSREVVAARLALLRKRLALSFVAMASAALIGYFLRSILTVPLPSRTLFAIGSLLAFATATLGRLGWEGQSIKGNSSVERIDQRIFHLLYWIGMCSGTLAVL